MNTSAEFLGCTRRNIPKKTTKENKEGSIQKDLEAVSKFLNHDVVSLFGQGPIKKTPIRKRKATNDEPLTPEMQIEMKKLFGENYDQFTY